MRGDRWYVEVGPAITAVRRVVVTRTGMFRGERLSSPLPSSYVEIETPHGRACVVQFSDYSAIQGYVGAGGARKLGTWTKYRQVRGHGVAWLLAQHAARGRRVNPNSSKTCPTACPAEVYARLTTTEHAWSPQPQGA